MLQLLAMSMLVIAFSWLIGLQTIPMVIERLAKDGFTPAVLHLWLGAMSAVSVLSYMTANIVLELIEKLVFWFCDFTRAVLAELRKRRAARKMEVQHERA